MPASKPVADSVLSSTNPGGFTTAWFINEGSGTTITDAGANNYVATFADSPPSWITAGLEFDDDGTLHGATATDVTDMAYGTGDFSIAFGYKRKEPDSSVGLTISVDGGSTWNGMYVSIRPTVMYVLIGTSTWYELPSSSSTADTVYNVVITFNRDGYARFFRNGSYVGQVDISPEVSTSLSASRVSFGGNPSIYSDNWQLEGEFHYFFSTKTLISDANAEDISADPYLGMADSSSSSNSPSQSPSSSASPSNSPSLSPSSSQSPSSSVSPSVSPSTSASPSAGYQGYTKGNYATLPTDDADLETALSAGDIANIATKNNERISQEATGEFAIYQFKDYVGAATAGTLEWEGQTNCAPSFSTVYLQIYNRNTSEWETVDSDNSSSVDTDFILTANIADLTNYKDTNTVISSRIYQEAV